MVKELEKTTSKPPEKPWLVSSTSLDDPGYYIGEGVGAPKPGEYDQWQARYNEWKAQEVAEE